MLTVDNTAPYLLDRGLIDADTVVYGDLEITSLTRRNRNLRVTTRDRGGLLLKQPSSAHGEEAHSVRREAAFHAWCATAPQAAALRSHLPRVIMVDEARAMVVFELLGAAQPIWRRYRERDAAAFPVGAARAAGRAIAVLHETLGNVRGDTDLAFLPDSPPWAFGLRRPSVDVRDTITPGAMRVLELIQEHAALDRLLMDANAMWSAPAVIHGDVRLDNILVEGEEGSERAVLVDWETAAFGDPAWDVAGGFQDFVFFWIMFMPHDRDPEKMEAAASYPLADLQRGMAGWWTAYRDARGFDAATASAFLDRALLFAAARLVQAAYEVAQNSVTLPSIAALMLQVASNAGADPARARRELFGLESA
jgi:Ser/Thr protein kinase RdoA (MazF antagonist)